MKLAALMVARNEEWCIGLSLRVALRWCDIAVVLLHACVDRTRAIVEEIAAEHPGRVTILEEPGGTWAEMAHRQKTLEVARQLGATHMAIADCDEVLVGPALSGIRGAIGSLFPGQYLSTQMYAMWRGIDQYRHDSSVWSDTVQRGLVLAFRDRPDLCWRTHAGYDHHHRPPYNSGHGFFFDGGIMHLQFASWRRLVAKHCWYKATERIRWPAKPVGQIEWMYSMATNEQNLGVAPAAATWWDPYRELLPNLDLDAEPWHEAEVRSMLAQRGPQYFEGLDLSGIETLCRVA